jgi:hypothetical protein
MSSSGGGLFGRPDPIGSGALLIWVIFSGNEAAQALPIHRHEDQILQN